MIYLLMADHHRRGTNGRRRMKQDVRDAVGVRDAPCHAEVVKIYRKPAEENYSSLAVSKDTEEDNLQLRRFR